MHLFLLRILEKETEKFGKQVGLLQEVDKLSFQDLCQVEEASDNVGLEEVKLAFGECIGEGRLLLHGDLNHLLESRGIHKRGEASRINRLLFIQIEHGLRVDHLLSNYLLPLRLLLVVV